MILVYSESFFIKSLWKSWLKKYLQNLAQNVPTEPDEEEKQAIIEWILDLKSIMADAIDIVCDKRELIPNQLPVHIFHNFLDANYTKQYEHELCKLIICLLESDCDVTYLQYNLGEVIQSFTGLDKQEKEQLDEALLKRGISCGLW